MNTFTNVNSNTHNAYVCRYRTEKCPFQLQMSLGGFLAHQICLAYWKIFQNIFKNSAFRFQLTSIHPFFKFMLDYDPKNFIFPKIP